MYIEGDIKQRKAMAEKYSKFLLARRPGLKRRYAVIEALRVFPRSVLNMPYLLREFGFKKKAIKEILNEYPILEQLGTRAEHRQRV